MNGSRRKIFGSHSYVTSVHYRLLVNFPITFAGFLLESCISVEQNQTRNKIIILFFFCRMLKHVQLSPYRTRTGDSRSSESTRIRHRDSTTSLRSSSEKQEGCSDSVSIASTTDLGPELPFSSLSSRSSSYSSLNETPTSQRLPTVRKKNNNKNRRSGTTSAITSYPSFVPVT